MGFFEFLTVIIVFGFVGSIVKMALSHAEKIARIKYGHPTIEVKEPHFIEDEEPRNNNRY